MGASGDSEELEALFDTVSAEKKQSSSVTAFAPVSEKQPSVMQQLRESDSTCGDSDDLQSLFDAIASEQSAIFSSVVQAPSASEVDEEGFGPSEVFNEVGKMARKLHDALGNLGYDTKKYDALIEHAADVLPDAKDRLSYIATLTEQAASKVLNATDLANPIQDELETASLHLSARWDALYANQLSVDDFKALAQETSFFLKESVPQKTSATRAQLMEIMMAQDFQDLTGQVIKKVISVSQELESQLMNLLVNTMPGEKRDDTSVSSLLNGPVISAVGRTDVVVNQEQVDDLLASLGF